MNTNEVVAAAKCLSEDERWEVVGRLLEDLDPGDGLSEDDWSAAWLPEIEARIAEAERDPSVLLDGPGVMEALRKRVSTRS